MNEKKRREIIRKQRRDNYDQDKHESNKAYFEWIAQVELEKYKQ